MKSIAVIPMTTKPKPSHHPVLSVPALIDRPYTKAPLLSSRMPYPHAHDAGLALYEMRVTCVLRNAVMFIAGETIALQLSEDPNEHMIPLNPEAQWLFNRWQDSLRGAPDYSDLIEQAILGHR